MPEPIALSSAEQIAPRVPALLLHWVMPAWIVRWQQSADDELLYEPMCAGHAEPQETWVPGASGLPETLDASDE